MPPNRQDVVRYEVEGVMTCRACGTVGYAGEHYCSRCGASFLPPSGHPVPIRTCPNCREPLRHPIAFYCAWCGEGLEEEPADR